MSTTTKGSGLCVFVEPKQKRSNWWYKHIDIPFFDDGHRRYRSFVRLIGAHVDTSKTAIGETPDNDTFSIMWPARSVFSVIFIAPKRDQRTLSDAFKTYFISNDVFQRYYIAHIRVIFFFFSAYEIRAPDNVYAPRSLWERSYIHHAYTHTAYLLGGILVPLW